jgi:hypothetical protein
MLSISDLRWCPAAATSSSTFSGVSFAASMQTAAKCNRPSATAANKTGNRRAARAAWVRL